MEDRTMKMPAIALRGLTVMPKMMIHFDITRPKSKAAAERSMVADQKVFLITQRQSDMPEPSIEDLFHMGCVAEIKQLVKLPDGVVRVMVEGLQKAVLLDLDTDQPALMAEIEVTEEPEFADYAAGEAMLRIVKEKLEEFGRENPRLAKELLPNLLGIDTIGELLDQVAVGMCPGSIRFARKSWRPQMCRTAMRRW